MSKQIAREVLLIIAILLVAFTSVVAAKIIATLVSVAFILYLIKKAI